MELLEHFQALTDSIKDTGEHSFTVVQASSVFSCSERNAKLLIKKMEQKEWIRWKPGQGRGNHSSIRLLKSVTELIYEEAQTLAITGSIDTAIQTIQSCSTQDQQRFLAWLSTQLMQHDDYDSGNHLRFPSYRPIPVLNPALVDRRSENHIMLHLFNRLVRFNEQNHSFSGELAHHWSVDGTHKTWTFYLRKGIYFHNGSLFTSEDIKKRFVQIHTFWGLRDLKTVSCIDAYTCQLSFNQPNPTFLHVAAALPCSIIHEESTALVPIGTGPFQIMQNTPQKLQMAAFDRYFESRPLLDDVTMYFFPNLYDNQPAYELASDNRLNFYPYPYQLPASIKLNQFEQIDRGCKLLTLNTTLKPTDDHLLREAIYHLLEPEQLIHACKGNRFVPASRLRSETETTTPSERSKKKGRRLLKESNYQGQALQLYTYNGAGNEADANWIQLHLAKAGIQIEIHVIPYEAFHSNQKKQAHLLLGEQLVYEDPCYTYLNAFFSSYGFLNGQQNSVSLNNPRFHQTQSLSSFLTFLEDMENQLTTQFTMIPLYRLKQFAIFPPTMKDVALNTFGWVDYTKLWIKPEGIKKS